MLYSKEP
ncbi:uncharacterized protein FFM5_04939 [Fusarium fujikuroi]|nr:uncharacterized protein FFM5_04939 [Fusarium fujikuroi]